MWSLKTIHKNCGSYKVFTDFHIWLTRSLSLSLSTVPPLPVQSIFRCDVCSLHILFDSVHPVLFFSSLRTTGVARYSCWSVSTNTQNLKKISWKCGCCTSNRQINRNTSSLQGNNSSSIQFKNVLLNFVGKPELHYLLVCLVWGTLKSCLWGRNSSGTRVCVKCLVYTHIYAQLFINEVHSSLCNTSITTEVCIERRLDYEAY